MQVPNMPPPQPAEHPLAGLFQGMPILVQPGPCSVRVAAGPNLVWLIVSHPGGIQPFAVPPDAAEAIAEALRVNAVTARTGLQLPPMGPN